MNKIFSLLILIIASGQAISQNLFELLEDKDYTRLEASIKGGSPTDRLNENGLPLAWMAISKNDTTALNIFIKNEVDIHQPDKNGSHPIVIGALADAVESVEILLKNGADVNFTSSYLRNQKPIRLASTRGSLRMIKLLVAYGADIESRSDDLSTPVIAAIYGNNLEMTRYYLEKGVKIDYVARDGECVIHEAIKTKNPEMVKLVLQYNPPLHYKDPKGRSTVQLAKLTGNSQIKSMIKKALSNK